MKLLLITQKVDRNDPILGFFREWIREFTHRCERLFVVGLSVAQQEYEDRPSKVDFFSLGKEKGAGKIRRLKNFFSYVFGSREYDAVFVHMNPIYVVLAGWYWKWWRRVPVVLWYVHRNVDWKLRLAVFFVDAIFTTSKDGCRVGGDKVKVVMHGIDVPLFQRARKTGGVIGSGLVRIVHVGRITSIKNCDAIIDAVLIIEQALSRPVTLTFIGEPSTTDDHVYQNMLRKRIQSKGLDKKVFFESAVPHHVLPERLRHFDVMVNATPTGGMDKVVLEAMVMSMPVCTSNAAFSTVFGSRWNEVCLFEERDPISLSAHITRIYTQDNATQSAMLDELASRASQFSVAVPVTHIVDFLKKK